MRARRGVGLVFIRNFILAVFVGLITGLITGSLCPPKKGKSEDWAWGIGGAVLASLLLAFLRGGPRLIPLLVVQLIGSLLLILVGRLMREGK